MAAAKIKFPALHAEIQKYGKSASGKTDLLNFARGKRLTPLQRCRAACYRCMGFYADGRMDCGIETCPLHVVMPYRGKSTDDTAQE